jgi:hypothetical protein
MEKILIAKQPIWIDNNSMLVGSRDGIYYVDINSGKYNLALNSGEVEDFDLLPGSSIVLVSIDGRLHTFDFHEGSVWGFEIKFNDPNQPDAYMGYTFDANMIKISPSGDYVAVGSESKLHILEIEGPEDWANDASSPDDVSFPPALRQGTRVAIADISSPVYDVVWQPDSKRLFCLAGKISYGLGLNLMSSSSRGQFRISSVDLSDTYVEKLYDKMDFDVRETCLDMSSNGEWLLMVSHDLNDRRYSIYVIATDASGMRKITHGDWYKYPVWRPVPVNRQHVGPTSSSRTELCSGSAWSSMRYDSQFGLNHT